MKIIIMNLLEIRQEQEKIQEEGVYNTKSKSQTISFELTR
jgi:hypothetical protein